MNPSDLTSGAQSSADLPAAQLAAAMHELRRVGSATIVNALLRRGLRNTYLLGISPLSQHQAVMVGEAYTLRFMPAREDIDTMANYARDDNLHRRAIEECPAGAVLVIDAFGCCRAASMGDMMAARLARRGVAGVVSDGGFRDTAAIVRTGLSCYQRQSAPPASPIALHPVELNGPVGCAGVAVYPGDVLLGDTDGVVVIPRHMVVDVAAEARDTEAYEQFAATRVAAGRSIFGLFPATEASRREYERWAAAGRPDEEPSA